jgi:CBS-domain-containing membrane protein
MSQIKATRLPVRKRRIMDGNGEATTTRSVLCPTHGQAVALTVCGECVRCESIDAAAVTCRPEVTRPAMRWAPLLRRMLPSAGDRVAIADVMSRDVVCVTKDVSIESLTALFLERGIGAAPVVDAEGYPIGMVSKTDLVREHWQNGDTAEVNDSGEMVDGMHVSEVTRATVADIMVAIAFTLQEDEPLSRAAAVMAVERVHHLPVVAADGRVVGILSSLDFVRWVAKQAAFSDQA